MKITHMIHLPIAMILALNVWSPMHAQSAEAANEKMMAPTEVLEMEHHLIKKLAVLAEKTATQIRGGNAFELEEVKQLHDFFKHFVDECHHQKEEKILFPRLKKLNVDPVIIDLLIKQHEEGRILLSGIEGILEKAEASLPTVQRTAIAEYLSQYSQLMERHIKLENDYLWPKASQALDKEAKKDIAEKFEQFEVSLGEGFHEKYHAVALKLLNKSGAR